MFSQKSVLRIIVLAFLSIVLSACGGSGSAEPGKVLISCDVPMVSDAAGTSCVAPEPIVCPAPTVPDALNESCVVGIDPNAPDPVIFPGDNQALLFYNRADGEYNDYKLHNWNSAECDAYAEDSLAAGWSDGLSHTGVDPVYGAYWLLNLKEEHNECGHMIIHKGTDDAGKEFGGGDFKMPLSQDDEKYQRMNFTFSGLSQPLIESAHTSRSACVGGSCGQATSRLPHCSTKNRMCSASARCGMGCPVLIANSIQTSYSAGQQSMASESLVPRSGRGLIGSLSATLACCRLMCGEDGMLVKVQGRRGARYQHLP